MLAHLNGGRADGTCERRLASYVRPDLLILNFGLKPLGGVGPEDLYEVINERYEKGSLILTVMSPSRPVEPAGTGENANTAFPDAWTAPTPRRAQAPQARRLVINMWKG